MDSGENEKVLRKNPRATAGMLSALVFSWTFEFFRRGFRRDLNISDLCEPLPEHTAQTLGDKFEEYWSQEMRAYKENPKRTPSLIRVMLKAYGGKILLYIVCIFFSEIIFRLGQPLLLGRLIQHFTPNSTVTYDEAKLYAGGVVLCVALNLITIPPIILAAAHVGMKLRVATSSLIYRKTLRLSQEARSRIGAGHLINMLSNDAFRYDYAAMFLPNALAGPFITIVVSYFLWREAGAVALIGVCVLLSFVPLQVFLARKIAAMRALIAPRTDKRIRLMNEIVAGIQVIKMYTWEKSFASLVGIARRKEVSLIRKKLFAVSFLYTTAVFSIKLALFGSLLVYALYNQVISADIVFAMVLCYTIVVDNFIDHFAVAVTLVAQSYVSVQRMEAFLVSDEATGAIAEEPLDINANGDIRIKDLCARWTLDNTDDTLTQLNVGIRSGSLVAIIGEVGSGKSSFLQLILREIPVKSGIIEVGGTLSYASQDPWLFGGTVCQNILFGQPMNKQKYRNVVRVCALEADFKQLPNGDKTLIGDRGICLSGGQKARINLARAVYREADIYLLDDPLSAVDSHVGRHLFEECICGYLEEKTVVLATHQVQRLSKVGHVIKLDAGKIVAQGSFQELCNIGVDLTSPEVSVTTEKKDQTDSTRKMSVKDETLQDDLPAVTEMSSSGKVSTSVYLAYLKGCASVPLAAFVAMAFVLAIIATSGCDYWLSFWVNNEEYVFPTEDYITVDLFGRLNRTFFLYVYGILVGTLIVLAIIRAIMYTIMCMKVSMNLHDTLFSRISQATMHFFHNTPSGQILNRFSGDTGMIDEVIPEVLSDCVRAALQVVGSLIIIFTINWYLMVPFVGVILVLYFLRRYFVATSRSMKRVESVTRSPIYTYINASLQGLTTIRALRAQTTLHQEFDRKQDIHSSAWYISLGTNRAFAYYLDLTCCVYTSLVIFSFLILDNQFLGGDVGLAITQTMGVTMLFQWFIRQSAELESEMVSVERVCAFSKVESESEFLVTATDQKINEWPSQGAVNFSNVSLYYDPNGQPELKNISFDIKPKQKVGVVGRTGAGKSSLVAALFRLQKIDGKITIDDVETSSIGLHDLRTKISIIPQDPVIFSGTMRFNLDPFGEYEDSDLWNVLEEVELKSLVQESPGGLLTDLAEGGVNLSVGQRQLVCLARAILKNSKILVLDEATANVDVKTDDFIQAAIRKRFAHCTVITIAHRLHTIMDSDRILVMDNGKVVEFGSPQDLLLNPKGHFTHLVQLAGSPTNITAVPEKIPTDDDP